MDSPFWQEKDTSGGTLKSVQRWRRWIITVAAFTAFVACTVGWTVYERQKPDQLLLDALYRKDFASADHALNLGANPNMLVPQCYPSRQLSDVVSFYQYKLLRPRQYYDIPLLFGAVMNHDSRSVRLLLAHSARPNYTTPNGLSTVQLAINSKMPDIVDMLKNAGAH